MFVGLIYKIVNTQNEDIYIGSTVMKYLCSRMASHHRDYKKWKNGSIDYCASFSMFDNVGVENCSIVLLEEYEYVRIDRSDTPLRMREQYYLDNHTCINIQRAYTSPEMKKEQTKQYLLMNKEEIKEQKKQYYLEHKDEINRKARETYKLKKSQLTSNI
jgi:hypothetical protein